MATYFAYAGTVYEYSVQANGAEPIVAKTFVNAACVFVVVE